MRVFLEQLINGLTIGSFYGLIALGYSMVYGVLKLINFAHGDFFTLGSYLGYTLLVFGSGVRDDPPRACGAAWWSPWSWPPSALPWWASWWSAWPTGPSTRRAGSRRWCPPSARRSSCRTSS